MSIFKIFKKSKPERSQELFDRIIRELKDSLESGLLDAWYPKAMDREYGGYFSDFNYKFQIDGPQDKTIINQSRHLWTVSKAAIRFPAKPHFEELAEHGYQFLKNKMWDADYGGFLTKVNRAGDRLDVKDAKTSYGNAFAIYSLAAFFETSKNNEALELAIQTFEWLNHHSYDPLQLGYFCYMDRAGNVGPLPSTPDVLTGKCFKGVNTSLHLLEAYSALYNVWPDPLLKKRLEELLILHIEKIMHTKGYLHHNFDTDWTPVELKHPTKSMAKKFQYLGHVSFGHDLEGAYLMFESAKHLNRQSDPVLLDKLKVLVQQSVDFGWDKRKGGLYHAGYYLSDRKKLTIINKSKSWWAQAEGLHSLLLFSNIFPDDERDYFNLFLKMWDYIKEYLLDEKYGDWYAYGLDRNPESKTQQKGTIWKVTYHSYRSLENCIDTLQKMKENM